MNGPLRILFPRRMPSGRNLPRPAAGGPVRSWFRQLLRIGIRMALFMAAAYLVLLAGFRNLDPMAALRWMEDSWVLLLMVRVSVYLLVIRYGPILRGVREEDLDRARLSLIGCAALLEGFGTLRLFL